MPSVEDGGIVEVQSSDKEFLCYAHWNSKAYIAGRAISFEQGDPLQALKRQIEDAIAMRRLVMSREDRKSTRLNSSHVSEFRMPSSA